MTITNTLANKFGVRNVEHCITFGRNQYFTAIDNYFDDEVEIKVVEGDVYIRLKVLGEDIDFEKEGVTDMYFHRGTLSVDKATQMLEVIEEFLKS